MTSMPSTDNNIDYHSVGKLGSAGIEEQGKMTEISHNRGGKGSKDGLLWRAYKWTKDNLM